MEKNCLSNRSRSTGKILSTETADFLNIKNILIPSKTRICTFSGDRVPVLGTANLEVNYKNTCFLVKFFIVNIQCKNIIGIETAVNMNLIRQVNEISIDGVMEKYSDVFSGLGCLQRKCEFMLRDNIRPVVEAPRKIPFKLMDKLKTELDRMVNLKVPEVEPTEWVNSVVLVTKPNGNLRICLDPRNLNKAILRPHYPFPSIEECKAKLNGSLYFSTLDFQPNFVHLIHHLVVFDF